MTDSTNSHDQCPELDGHITEFKNLVSLNGQKANNFAENMPSVVDNTTVLLKVCAVSY